MKKNHLLLILVLVIALTLCACGSSSSAASTAAAPAATAVPTAEPAPTAAPTEAPAQEAPAEEPSAEPEADPVEEIKALVLSMKGEPIEDLIAIIGEPNSSDYGSSCLIQGGKDGMLFYDGFTVYTLVQPDGTETVYDVE